MYRLHYEKHPDYTMEWDLFCRQVVEDQDSFDPGNLGEKFAEYKLKDQQSDPYLDGSISYELYKV
jgi:hypothetical protein